MIYNFPKVKHYRDVEITHGNPTPVRLVRGIAAHQMWYSFDVANPDNMHNVYIVISIHIECKKTKVRVSPVFLYGVTYKSFCFLKTTEEADDVPGADLMVTYERYLIDNRRTTYDFTKNPHVDGAVTRYLQNLVED